MRTSLAGEATGFPQIGKDQQSAPALIADRRPYGEFEGMLGFDADSCRFFLDPFDEDTQAARWGLSFGPIRSSAPRWSIFRYLPDGRVDTRVVFAGHDPSALTLRAWSTSIVGLAIANALIGVVGFFPSFYERYYSERPDLLVSGPGSSSLRWSTR